MGKSCFSTCIPGTDSGTAVVPAAAAAAVFALWLALLAGTAAYNSVYLTPSLPAAVASNSQRVFPTPRVAGVARFNQFRLSQTLLTFAAAAAAAAAAATCLVRPLGRCCVKRVKCLIFVFSWLFRLVSSSPPGKCGSATPRGRTPWCSET